MKVAFILDWNRYKIRVARCHDRNGMEMFWRMRRRAAWHVTLWQAVQCNAMGGCHSLSWNRGQSWRWVEHLLCNGKRSRKSLHSMRQNHRRRQCRKRKPLRRRRSHLQPKLLQRALLLLLNGMVVDKSWVMNLWRWLRWIVLDLSGRDRRCRSNEFQWVLLRCRGHHRLVDDSGWRLVHPEWLRLVHRTNDRLLVPRFRSVDVTMRYVRLKVALWQVSTVTSSGAVLCSTNGAHEYCAKRRLFNTWNSTITPKISTQRLRNTHTNHYQLNCQMPLPMAAEDCH